MTTPLEDFGMVGDGATVALVSRMARVQWLCLPRFDSPACFAALLGGPEHGQWSIAPTQVVLASHQTYQAGTLVLETEFTTGEGTIRVTDFMPVGATAPMLVRIVTGVTGSVQVSSDIAPRFEYGQTLPWIEASGAAFVCKAGADEVWLHGFGDARPDEGKLAHSFTVAAGQQQVFSLVYAPFNQLLAAPCAPPDALALLDQTQRYWREWLGTPTHDSAEHEAALRRSLLTLKALVYRPTGGLVAAPTTSLPEMPGGKLNWDYRYCWLRDASFAVDALIGCGFVEEAQAWRDWLLRAVGSEPEKMRIVYRLDGSRRLDEAVLTELPGYRFAQPVRIGNAAAGQFQLDVYGELMNMLHLCETAGLPASASMHELQRAVARHVAKVWMQPDQGLWESRAEPHHYTYSKVMAWVAIDRFLRGTASAELAQGERKTWADLRDRMHRTICEEGFDAGLNSFTDCFGDQRLDASLLLLPKLGFLPADEPRMAATIDAIERHLVRGGLVYRHDMHGKVFEGAFLACTFWLAECRILQQRGADARTIIDRVLGLCGPLGLFSEEYDAGSKRLSGNFPQAFTHTALVNAVRALRTLEAGASS